MLSRREPIKIARPLPPTPAANRRAPIGAANGRLKAADLKVDDRRVVVRKEAAVKVAARMADAPAAVARKVLVPKVPARKEAAMAAVTVVAKVAADVRKGTATATGAANARRAATTAGRAIARRAIVMSPPAISIRATVIPEISTRATLIRETSTHAISILAAVRRAPNRFAISSATTTSIRATSTRAT